MFPALPLRSLQLFPFTSIPYTDTLYICAPGGGAKLKGGAGWVAPALAWGKSTASPFRTPRCLIFCFVLFWQPSWHPAPNWRPSVPHGGSHRISPSSEGPGEQGGHREQPGVGSCLLHQTSRPAGLFSCPPSRRLFSPGFGFVLGENRPYSQRFTPLLPAPAPARWDLAPIPPRGTQKSLGPDPERRERRHWGMEEGVLEPSGKCGAGSPPSSGEEKRVSSGLSRRKSPLTLGRKETLRLRGAALEASPPAAPRAVFWGGGTALLPLFLPPPFPAGSPGAARVWLRAAPLLSRKMSQESN